MRWTAPRVAAALQAIQRGPVSVAIEANHAIFQSYKSGVITNATACGTALDHAVLLVGLLPADSEAGEQVYVVKNSWGPAWGEKGYVRISTAGAAQGGVCGIAMAPSQPHAKPGVAPPLPPPTPGSHPALPCNCTEICESNCKSLFGLTCCGNQWNPPVLGHCVCGTAASCPKCQIAGA